MKIHHIFKPHPLKNQVIAMPGCQGVSNKTGGLHYLYDDVLRSHDAYTTYWEGIIDDLKQVQQSSVNHITDDQYNHLTCLLVGVYSMRVLKRGRIQYEGK